MGVDFLSCKSCGETFPDCGHFVGCECGEHWCCEDCAESDGFQHEEEGSSEFKMGTRNKL